MQGRAPIRSTPKAFGANAAYAVFTADDGLHVGFDFGNFQVVCKGMDGGTATVQALFPDGVWRSLTSNLAETAVFVTDENMDFLQLRINGQALGINAAATAMVSATGRRYRYEG